MGIGGISIWQLLIILAIVIMLFGTKRLRTLGSDLGSAVKGFRSSMSDDSEAQTPGGDGSDGGAGSDNGDSADSNYRTGGDASGRPADESRDK